MEEELLYNQSEPRGALTRKTMTSRHSPSSSSSSSSLNSLTVSSLSALPAPSDSAFYRGPSSSSSSAVSSSSGSPSSRPSLTVSSAGPSVSAASSSGRFVVGTFPCPGCSVVCPSAKELIVHVNNHVVGLLSPADFRSDSFVDLNYEPCDRCHRFYVSGAGLKAHKRSCDKQSVVVADPFLRDALGDLEDDYLPSLEEIFTANVPTVSSVPTGCQQVWGTVLERELSRVVRENTVEAWSRLLMLPKCVLVASRRGGKRNRGDRLSVSYLCDAWTRGELKWLWARATRAQQSSKGRSSGLDSKRISELAITHVRHGRLGKACSVLSSSGLAPDTDETGEKLASKHPQAEEPPAVLAAEGDSEPLKVSSEFNLRGVLASFAKDVGTDGTNFRVQHLLDGCNSHLPRPVLGSLRNVVNLLLSGTVNEGVRPYLAGAKLTALAKGESDIRPIAAGNVFRRIASKCVCQMGQARFRSTLGKLQVGVACPAGAESVVHMTRDIVDRNFHVQADFVLLKVDFANAFNSIDRHKLLLQCRKLFPDLLPWVTWCYGGQPWLFHPTGNIQSCVGVQQGDPLGPL